MAGSGSTTNPISYRESDRDMKDKSQTPIQSRLMQTLLNDGFALTAEIIPPVSAGPDELYEQVDLLGEYVDAINLAD